MGADKLHAELATLARDGCDDRDCDVCFFTTIVTPRCLMLDMVVRKEWIAYMCTPREAIHAAAKRVLGEIISEMIVEE